MELHHIRAFVAVAEELHFGRAAVRLHIAQPPLSRAIQQLERELESKLFERSTRSVRLTPAGEAFLEPAREVLEGVRRAQDAVTASRKGETGKVRVAFAGASTHLMVGRLARIVRQSHPGIDFQLYSSNYAFPALEKVINREMEIGIGRWNFIPPGIAVRPVANEHLVIALSIDHPLSGNDSIHIQDLKDEAFVTLPPFAGSVLSTALQELATKAGFVPNVVQIAPDSWTLISLVGAGIGCALTVSSVADNITNPDVRFLRVADDAKLVQLQMAWREDEVSPALMEVLRIAEDVLPSP